MKLVMLAPFRVAEEDRDWLRDKAARAGMSINSIRRMVITQARERDEKRKVKK